MALSIIDDGPRRLLSQYALLTTRGKPQLDSRKKLLAR